MAYERLSATDASFLYLETDHEPQHVGSLGILEGGALRSGDGRIRIDEIRSRIEGRLHHVPRLRQRIRNVPLRQGRPVWIDDAHFDITYHVRLTSLPTPGDHQQLLDLMARLQALPLDRSRPLWEIWLVDGLEDGNVGQIIKTHHSIGDGIANVDMVLALVDAGPDAGEEAPAPPWRPRPAPSGAELLVGALGEQLRRPASLVRNATTFVRHPDRAVKLARDLASTATMLGDRPPRAPWNTDVSAHRRWVDALVDMDTVKAIRKSTDIGATLNDVVLAACAGALRDFLLDRGEEVPPDRRLAAMVPVSRRMEDERGQVGNRVSMIVADLPVGDPDPLGRLAAIRTQTAQRKDSGMSEGAEAIIELSGALPVVAPELARMASRQFPMNLVITNVPGPPSTLWMYGSRVLAAYPYVEVIDKEGLTIAVLSYEGRLHFGLTADRDVMADLPSVARGIERHVGIMEAMAG